MRKADAMNKSFKALYGVAVVVLALMLSGWLSLVASAAGTGTVTASAAKVRKEASTSSEQVGSVSKDATVTINSEAQGSDGYVWYNVTTASGVTGYIRSDLLKKNETGGTDTPATVNPSVAVTEVQPVGGSITGGSNVRVRSDASTNGGIITTVSSGTAVTVTGQATGTDGYVWYLLKFTANGAETQGFVRSDFVSVSGELVPPATDPEVPDTPDTPEVPDDTDTPEVPDEPAEQKMYDTRQDEEGSWHLLDYAKNEEWDIVKLLDSYQKNGEELVKVKGSLKTQKIVIVVMVVLLIAAVLLATMMYFKIKDMSDDAYFSAVEKQTIRERSTLKGQSGRPAPPAGRKVMQTVGADEMGGQKATAPQGQRPAAPHTRPVSAGVQVGQSRPVQPGQPRPAQPGQRPVQPGQRPAAPAPKPANAGNPAPSRPAPQPKKPAVDDDEFEFEFLNWDGDEK